GLLGIALPMNFTPNLAYLHDFFVLLYVPAIALGCGLLAGRIAQRFPERVARRVVLGGLAAFVAVDVIPAARIVGPRPEEAIRLARAAERGTSRAMFVVNCGATPWELPEGFSRCLPASPVAGFQLWQDATVRAAAKAGGRGTSPATVRR